MSTDAAVTTEQPAATDTPAEAAPPDVAEAGPALGHRPGDWSLESSKGGLAALGGYSLEGVQAAAEIRDAFAPRLEAARQAAAQGARAAVDAARAEALAGAEGGAFILARDRLRAHLAELARLQQEQGDQEALAVLLLKGGLAPDEAEARAAAAAARAAVLDKRTGILSQAEKHAARELRPELREAVRECIRALRATALEALADVEGKVAPVIGMAALLVEEARAAADVARALEAEQFAALPE
jgi:hypothetical protein